MRRAWILAFMLLAACAAQPPQPAAPEPPADGIATAAFSASTDAPRPLPPPRAAPAAPLPASLTQAEIDQAFDRQRRAFFSLYQERLKAQPKLAGTAYLSFVVQPDGRVVSLWLAGSTLNDPAFEQGLLRQVSRITFPSAASPTPVERYPLVFKPR